MQFLTMSFPMENSLVLIANVLTRPPWRYLFTYMGTEPRKRHPQGIRGSRKPKLIQVQVPQNSIKNWNPQPLPIVTKYAKMST